MDSKMDSKMDAKIKVEPQEVFFYLDKLIRKIKIFNFNEYPIKFELLTVLNDLNLSPLQANETQAIIEPEQSFSVSLEYKDSKEKNCDSLIILAIYKVIENELIDPEPIQEPIHVPFHFRKVQLVNPEPEKNLNRKPLENVSNLDRPISKDQPISRDSDKKPKDENIDGSSADEKPASSDSEAVEQNSPTKIKKKNRFTKPARFQNLFRSNKPKEKASERLGKLVQTQQSKGRQQVEASSLKEIEKLEDKSEEKSEEPSDSHLSDGSSDAKEDNLVSQVQKNVKELGKGMKRALDKAKNISPDLKQIGNQIGRQIGSKMGKPTRRDSSDTNYQDDLSLYEHNQLNSLRYEEDNVRKLAKIIFLFTFFNLCYTVFLAFFNPLNKNWHELIDTYNLNSTSGRCSAWPKLGQLFKNMTAFKKSE